MSNKPVSPPSNARVSRKDAAFTLVELLVVIGIIALLIGILLPALNKARRAAQEVKCMSNIRQLCLGMNIYADANKGFIPGDGGDGTPQKPITVCTGPNGDVPLTWDDPSLWFNAIPPQIGIDAYYDQQQTGRRLAGPGDNSVFVCPSADAALPTAADVGIVNQGPFLMLFGAPAGGNGFGIEKRPVYICYVLNSKMNATQKDAQKISQMRPGQSVVAFMEKRMTDGELPGNDPQRGKNLGQLKGEWKRFTTRHRGGGFLGFFDGHVAWFSNKELATPLVQNPLDYNDQSKAIWDPFGPEN